MKQEGPIIAAEPTLERLGDYALLLHWPQERSLHLNRRVQQVAKFLRRAQLPGVIDIVPTFASLAIIWARPSSADADLVQRVTALVRTFELSLGQKEDETEEPLAPLYQIPVCYGGDAGPDLELVSKLLGMGAEQVVALHCGAEYVVAMLGFQPGFPYLLGLDQRLILARRPTPRISVPAGSVAIGGAQSGIYPRPSPGGWHLIGRTAVTLFDERADSPTLLQPGDRVRFVAVDSGARP